MYKLSSTSYSTSTIALTGIPGTTYRLVFSWKSDVTDIANPPAALDEILLTSRVPVAADADTGMLALISVANVLPQYGLSLPIVIKPVQLQA